jgi:hypothetical protein
MTLEPIASVQEFAARCPTNLMMRPLAATIVDAMLGTRERCSRSVIEGAIST